MGIFDKFKKKGKKDNKAPKVTKDSKQDKNIKEKPQKKGLFNRFIKKTDGGKGGKGGKKKNHTLVERMGLRESVASASLEVVEDLVERGDSAVREVDEGFLIVAITNDMLVESGIDETNLEKDEDFGQFVDHLGSEIIESITLSGDLDAGVIGIIPSQETLVVLDEYDFIHDMPLKWAIVPFDLSDDDSLILLDSTVYIEKLVELANHPDIILSVNNGEVVDSDEYETDDVSEEDYEPEETGFEEYDETLDSVPDYEEDESFDGLSEYEEEEEDDDAYSEPYEPETYDTYEPYDGSGDDFESDLDDEVDTFDSFDLDEELDDEVAETIKTETIKMAEYSFNNNELGISIDMKMFDDYFDPVTIASFDTTYNDGSKLDEVISKLRGNANTELARFHQDNIIGLRHKYSTSLREIHNKLVETLDHKDQDTLYGEKYKSIQHDYDEQIDDLDEISANKIEELKNEYGLERERRSNQAKAEADALYDSRHKDGLNTQISNVKSATKTELSTDRDVNIGELLSDRHTVANRLFDKATTSLIQNLQDEYRNMAQKELAMYDAFRKDMDKYQRRHFADDVLSSKAKAEELRQSHEAERIRDEYQQLFVSKEKQLDAVINKHRQDINDLDATHRQQMDALALDHERRMENELKNNEDLNKLVKDANNNVLQVGKQKETEVASIITTLENNILAKDKELDYANNRAVNSQKPLYIIAGVLLVLGISVGVLIGFISGLNQFKNIPESTPTTQIQDVGSTSYLEFEEGTDYVFVDNYNETI